MKVFKASQKFFRVSYSFKIKIYPLFYASFGDRTVRVKERQEYENGKQHCTNFFLYLSIYVTKEY